MNIFAKIAEERILDSMRKGEFENLEGAGKPQAFEDDSMVPEDLRMAYKILKNSGFTPPEVTERKEIVTMMDLLENATDEQERYRQIQKLNLMITQSNMRRSQPISWDKEQTYYEKIVSRVSVNAKHKS